MRRTLKVYSDQSGIVIILRLLVEAPSGINVGWIRGIQAKFFLWLSEDPWKSVEIR